MEVAVGLIAQAHAEFFPPNRRQIQLAWDRFDEGLRAERQAETDADKKTAEGLSAEIMDSPEVLTGMAGTVFICKAHAGEPISWDEAQGYAWPEDVKFVIEAADLRGEPPDPQAASGSATQPDAAKKSVKRTPAKTSAAATRRTSKPK